MSFSTAIIIQNDTNFNENNIDLDIRKARSLVTDPELINPHYDFLVAFQLSIGCDSLF